MSHYVIGDVQGCYDELINLCSKIKFNPKKDTLIFAGDLVNRGPKSLEVLNFCLENRKSIKAVLGNHDFYLLYLIEHKKRNKSLKKILSADNISKIQKWLKKLPLLLKLKIKNDKLDIQFRLWDVLSQKQMVAQKLSTEKDNWRRN